MSSPQPSARRRTPPTTTTALLLLASYLGSTEAFLGVRPPPRTHSIHTPTRPSTTTTIQREATTLHNPDDYLPQPSSSTTPRASAGADTDTLQTRLFVNDARRVILFDGDCGFCSDVVNLFLNFDGDPRGAFRFASLQGEIGQELLKLNNMDTKHFNTIVLVEKERIYTKSDAVLEIADRLKEPFPALAQVAKIFPLGLRDMMYHFVSSNRHLLAGEKDQCRIPSESEMDRFLD